MKNFQYRMLNLHIEKRIIEHSIIVLLLEDSIFAPSFLGLLNVFKQSKAREVHGSIML